MINAPISGGKVDNLLEYKYNSVNEGATSLTDEGSVFMLDLERSNLVRPSSRHLLNSRDRSWNVLTLLCEVKLKMLPSMEWSRKEICLRTKIFKFSILKLLVYGTYHICCWHSFWWFASTRTFSFPVYCYHYCFLFRDRAVSASMLFLLKHHIVDIIIFKDSVYNSYVLFF